jgi:hypothetical protein
VNDLNGIEGVFGASAGTRARGSLRREPGRNGRRVLATGTRGWTTLLLSVVTRKRPDFSRRVVGSRSFRWKGERWQSAPPLTGPRRHPGAAGRLCGSAVPFGGPSVFPAPRVTRAHTFADDFAPAAGLGANPSAGFPTPPGDRADSGRPRTMKIEVNVSRTFCPRGPPVACAFLHLRCEAGQRIACPTIARSVSASWTAWPPMSLLK